MSHSSAQTEWNKIKTDEKLVQEKIDEYLEKSRSAGDVVESNEENQDRSKKTRGRKKKLEKTDENSKSTRATARQRKKRTHSSDLENDLINENEKDDQEQTAPMKIRTAAEILAKKSKAPAQEKVTKELYEINERIIQLVQVKNMGMATVEQEKQLKRLLVEQKKKSNDLKRLKAEQAAKKRYREAKKVSNRRFISIHFIEFFLVLEKTRSSLREKSRIGC